MRQMIADMDKGIALRKSPKNVSEWLDEWVELYLPNVEETTRIGYKTKIRCYLKPAIGDILVQSLRAGHVQKMVNDMLARGLSPKNIRDTFNNINAAMKKAACYLFFLTAQVSREPLQVTIYAQKSNLTFVQLAPSEARMFKVPPQPEESTCASKCFLLTEMRFALQQDLLPRKRPEGVGGDEAKPTMWLGRKRWS